MNTNAMLLVPLVVACASVSLGCGGSLDELTTLKELNQDTAAFAPVSSMMEKRCGSIDCHGNISRPLRIYGKFGLRNFTTICEAPYYPRPTPSDEAWSSYVECVAAAQNSLTHSGGRETTTSELEKTIQSIIGLEPERTAKVFDPNDTEFGPYDLMLMRKPLLIERHKGGKLMLRGGAAARCLETWLSGAVETVECQLATEVP